MEELCAKLSLEELRRVLVGLEGEVLTREAVMATLGSQDESCLAPPTTASHENGATPDVPVPKRPRLEGVGHANGVIVGGLGTESEEGAEAGAFAAAPSPEPAAGGSGLNGAAGGGEQGERKGKKKKVRKTGRPFDFSRFRFRHVALQLMYEGENYSGFAAQAPGTEDTVELRVFEALRTVKLAEDGPIVDYSRCGRTDKGVSAFGQVLGFRLRSNFPLAAAAGNPNGAAAAAEGNVAADGSMAAAAADVDVAMAAVDAGGAGAAGAANDAATAGEETLPPHPEDELMVDGRAVKELDYCGLLNKVLPSDIRAVSWAPVTPGFSARFSCSDRRYRYFFARGKLDVDAMHAAAQRFVGDHDFRNFCKMDAANVNNFRRRIKSISVTVVSGDAAAAAGVGSSFEVCRLEVCGQAFLWHMVRCLAAVLFLVGAKLESPEVIDALMDPERCPRRPNYLMAPECGLVLHECRFQHLRFCYQPEVLWRLQRHLMAVWEEAAVRAARLRNYLDALAEEPVRRRDVDALIAEGPAAATGRKAARNDSGGKRQSGDGNKGAAAAAAAAAATAEAGATAEGASSCAAQQPMAAAALQPAAAAAAAAAAEPAAATAAAAAAAAAAASEQYLTSHAEEGMMTWAAALAELEVAGYYPRGTPRGHKPLTERATGKSLEERLEVLGGRKKERLDRNNAIRATVGPERNEAFFETKKSFGNANANA